MSQQYIVLKTFLSDIGGRSLGTSLNKLHNVLMLNFSNKTIRAGQAVGRNNIVLI